MSEESHEGFWDRHAFVRIRGRSRIASEPSQVILESKIYMGNVRSQDDIFEGHPKFASPSPVAIADVYALATKQMPGATPEHVKAEVEVIMARLADEKTRSEMVEQIASQLDAQYAESSILSFFRSISDQRSWAQYGEDGRGHAFVFDFRSPWPLRCGVGMDPIEAVPFPVRYMPDGAIPDIPIRFGPHDKEDGWRDIESALLMKLETWSDQKEERLIRVGIGEGLVDFPHQSLKAVVLGYNAPPADAALILDLCKQRKGVLAVYKLHADRREKRLILELIQGVAPH